MKLISIRPSNKATKKWSAVFEISPDKDKIVDFGAKGYSDYTIHKDPERKERYLKRHKRNEDWDDPLTPGALSKWLLWNKPTLYESVLDYKRRFKL